MIVPVESLGREAIPRTLYLDMDGVLADFDRAYMERWGTNPKTEADSLVWSRIDGCHRFFRDMPPCEGAIEFFREVEYLQPIILTACPRTNYAQAAAEKRAWIRRHLSKTVMVLPVMGGINKPLFMHQPEDVLIDDYKKNIAAWEAAGGFGILHTDWDTTRVLLATGMEP